MDKVFISAQELLVDSFKLAHQIYTSGFRPQFIVGVWRGGAPVGIAVQEYLDYVAELDAKIKAVRPEAGIKVTPKFGVPGLRPEENGKAEALVRRLTGDNSTNVVSYGTEAGHFQNEAISTVICGPGSIDQAHQADEYISVDQYNQGSKFMSDLIAELS